MAKRPWTIEFYTDPRGRNPVLEFIKSLAPKERAQILRAIDFLQEFGIALGLPHARPIAGLWELRAGPGRLFYFAHAGRRFIILHGYRKQTQKTPGREIETAKRRLTDFLERER